MPEQTLRPRHTRRRNFRARVHSQVPKLRVVFALPFLPPQHRRVVQVAGSQTMRELARSSLSLSWRLSLSFPLQDDLHRPPPPPGPRLRRPIRLRRCGHRHVGENHEASVRRFLQAFDRLRLARARPQRSDRVRSVPRCRDRGLAGAGDRGASEEPAEAGETGEERRV